MQGLPSLLQFRAAHLCCLPSLSCQDCTHWLFQPLLPTLKNSSRLYCLLPTPLSLQSQSFCSHCLHPRYSSEARERKPQGEFVGLIFPDLYSWALFTLPWQIHTPRVQPPGVSRLITMSASFPLAASGLCIQQELNNC